MLTYKEKSVILRNGLEMPLSGLGCWMVTPDVASKTVEYALDVGYRLIDTAYAYGNEKEVGEGIKAWLKKSPENKREDIFVVTKMPVNGMTSEGVQRFFKMSYDNLGLSYIDLYLVHVPLGLNSENPNAVSVFEGNVTPDYGTDLIAIWKSMESLVDSGKVKSIGISNFSVKQMRKIHAIARIPPVTNQVELHLYYQRKELHQYAKENDVVPTGYASLGSAARTFSAACPVPHLMEDPVVKLVAQNHKVTPAQILLKFLVQSGIIVIPKSTNPERIKQNISIYHFTLTSVEMEALESLDKGKDGCSFKAEVLMPIAVGHPEFPEYL